MANWIKRNKFWLLATLIVPLVTVGYDYLEKTTFYDLITGTSKLRLAVNALYSSGPGLQHGLFNTGTSSAEFKSLTKLVQTNQDKIDSLVPTFILRMAIKNAPYINMPPDLDKNLKYMNNPGSEQLIIGTDFSLAVLGSCPHLDFDKITFPVCKVKEIGNRYELEQKIEDRKKKFRMNFNLVVTLLSIIVAVRERKFS